MILLKNKTKVKKQHMIMKKDFDTKENNMNFINSGKNKDLASIIKRNMMNFLKIGIIKIILLNKTVLIKRRTIFLKQHHKSKVLRVRQLHKKEDKIKKTLIK